MKKIFRIGICLMLCACLTVSAFAAGGNPFVDVPDNAWYTGSVLQAYENGWISGTAANRFSPNQALSRAMIVTILWKLEGAPAPKDTGITTYFFDVDETDWYADAVAWAHSYGIVSGYIEPTSTADDDFNFQYCMFKGKNTLARGEMAVIMQRYAEYRETYDPTVAGDLSAFADEEAALAHWGSESLAWAVGAGLLSGKLNQGGLYLDPAGRTTRAQFVTILCRFLETY